MSFGRWLRGKTMARDHYTKSFQRNFLMTVGANGAFSNIAIQNISDTTLRFGQDQIIVVAHFGAIGTYNLTSTVTITFVEPYAA